jgi:hypothetical protein
MFSETRTAFGGFGVGRPQLGCWFKRSSAGSAPLRGPRPTPFLIVSYRAGRPVEHSVTGWTRAGFTRCATTSASTGTDLDRP